MCSSQGCDQELSTLEEALQDARQALPECPTLLVAASMGAWIAASLAQAPQVRGVLLLAPSGRTSALKGPGGCTLPSPYSQRGYRINEQILSEQETSIETRMPPHSHVRIVHGDLDTAVPLGVSEALQKKLREKGVAASLRRVPGGDHRLSSPPELRILGEELEQLADAT